jgi:hypothetical protein
LVPGPHPPRASQSNGTKGRVKFMSTADIEPSITANIANNCQTPPNLLSSDAFSTKLRCFQPPTPRTANAPNTYESSDHIPTKNRTSYISKQEQFSLVYALFTSSAR